MKILYLLTFGYTFCFAYLDPASGSLLLSSIVALFASFIFFIKSSFYKILSFVMGGGGRTPLKSENFSLCFYAEDKRYYHTFKGILDTLDRFHYPYTYYTSSDDDPAFNRSNTQSIHYLRPGNPTYTKLNTLECDLLVMTTPGLNILHIKRNKGIKHYCHIVHSLTPMTYRVFGVDYFDSVLVSNEIQKDFVREVEKAHHTKAKYIAIVGSTYLDELDKIRAESTLDSYHSIHSLSTSNPTSNPTLQNPKSQAPKILVSPSWGKESLLSRFGLKLLLPLAQSGFEVLIRPHPQSFIGKEESDNIKYLQNALSSYKNISWDIDTPNVYAMAWADLLIGDFSSSIFDFVCLFDKPILSLDFTFNKAGYDMADIEGEMWAIKTLKEISIRLKESDFSHIKDIIMDTLVSHFKRTQIKNALWRYKGKSAIVATREIINLHASTFPANTFDKIKTMVTTNIELDKLLGESKVESNGESLAESIAESKVESLAESKQDTIQQSTNTPNEITQKYETLDSASNHQSSRNNNV